MEERQKILIVDDDKMNLKILTIILEDSYDIKTAKNGEEALRVLDGFFPDIILLDVMMPGIDGFEVCRRIRAESWSSKIKILLLTAKTALNDRLDGYDAGADDYITKPFEEEELVAKVKVFARLNDEEKKLKQLNRRLLLRQQDIPNLLWDCDMNLCFTHVDDNASMILGYTPEKMIGKPIADFIVQSEIGEFFLKFREDTNTLTDHIRGLTFHFTRSDGQEVSLQIFADQVFNDKNQPIGMVGILRDIRAITQLDSNENVSDSRMTIRINDRYQVVYAKEKASQILETSLESQAENPDFLQFLVDDAMANLFPFSFDQKEDVPFPVEIKTLDSERQEKFFSVTFKFITADNCLEGTLVPVRADDRLAQAAEKLASQEKKISDQDQALKSAIVVDQDMQSSILTDARYLSSEILELIKSLENYAYSGEGKFNPDEFRKFLFNRNLGEYANNLRLLGNKIHGLKGSCGFLMTTAKQLCHKMEDITRPLAEQKLVLTVELARLLKQFIFKIDEMLDGFESNPESVFPVDEWLDRIDRAKKKSETYIGPHLEEFMRVLTERIEDRGEVRQRKKEEYLSVSLTGYEVLAEKVKELFYTLSESLKQEELIQASNLYNQFLSTHQQIKKIPINLSRYERLIPNLAKDYEKEAEFRFIDHQVKADLEFWNGVHEILNHVLKNAVIHGIETLDNRKQAGKDPTGNVTVEIREDALHILLSASDDGRGINVERLKAKAVAENIISSEQAAEMGEQEALSLLFLQGVSTADSLDDNAGRGVGMNAVQETVKHLQGECHISNEPGKGCGYLFSFQKSNVSLPCIIVAIDDLSLAIPEDYVESFVDYLDQNVVTVRQKLAYKYNEGLVPLVDSKQSFDKEALNANGKASSVMILNHQGERRGMIINTILHHANLPILPLPKLYRNVPIYQGITIFNNDPIQVINVEKLDS